MVRRTSKEAFDKIKESGLLSARRWEVYEILFEHGPLIGSKVAEIYREKYGKTSESETVRNRLTELRDAGVVTEVGKERDPRTDMRVILWDVTDNLPVKFEKPHRETCKTCQGKGYIETQQAKFNL